MGFGGIFDVFLPASASFLFLGELHFPQTNISGNHLPGTVPSLAVLVAFRLQNWQVMRF